MFDKLGQRLEVSLETLLFASRWLLAPFYLGLALSLVVLLIKFIEEFFHIAGNAFHSTEAGVILGVLSLVDLSLTGSLLVIVIFSGYENFVSRIDHSKHKDWPEWMGTVDFTALSEILQYFYFGLELLFMLSGFVILKTVQNKTALGFLSARVVRLYPTYWVCVTLTALALLVANHSLLSVDLPRYLANLTMVQTALGYEHIDGVYWTFEVQLIFYGWVFLVCLVKQIHNAGKFLGVWLVAAISMNIFGGFTFTKLDYLLLPKLSFYFIAGAAFFLLYQRGRSLYLWSLIGACYLMAVKLALADPRNGNPSAALAGNTLLFLLFARMVLHDHRLAGKPWMITLFKMTYPLFLLHQDIGYVVLSKLDGLMPKYLLLLLVITTMLLASYVISTQIDRRVMPVFKKGVDRLLDMLGDPGPRQQPRHAQAQDAASAPGKASEEIAGQGAMQTSAETIR